jgi:hypothetical protein
MRPTRPAATWQRCAAICNHLQHLDRHLQHLDIPNARFQRIYTIGTVVTQLVWAFTKCATRRVARRVPATVAFRASHSFWRELYARLL